MVSFRGSTTRAQPTADYRGRFFHTWSPAGDGGVLFLTLAFLLHPSYQAPSLTAGDHCRITELLIGAVSWLAMFGFIAAAIAEAFR